MNSRHGFNRFVAAGTVLALALFTASLAVAADAIPAGTRVQVRIGNSLSSGTATSGQAFDGTVATDVVVNGKTIITAGTPVKGKVTNAKSSGRLHAPGILTVRLTAVGDQAVTSSAVSRQGKGHTKSNVTKIGGGTAAGAVIGALAGGGKGAAICAGVGAAAGTGVAAATGKMEAVIPAEAVLSFTVSPPGAAQRAK